MKPVASQMICRFVSHMSLYAVLTLQAQFVQSLAGAQQGLVLFAEAEADLLCAARRVAVKRRAGDAGDADLLDEMARERNVVREAERADVGHDVVRAVGAE